MQGRNLVLRGEMWCIFVSSPLTLAVDVHNFTAFTAFHRKNMYKFAVKKKQFFTAYLTYFSIFLDPGLCHTQ